MAGDPEKREVQVGIYPTEIDQRWGGIVSGSVLATEEDWRALGFEGDPMESEEVKPVTLDVGRDEA